jgi:hypothetical protein
MPKNEGYMGLFPQKLILYIVSLKRLKGYKSRSTHRVGGGGLN